MNEGENMIVQVIVEMETADPEGTGQSLRVESVLTVDDEGRHDHHDELVDGEVFGSVDALRDHVAKTLGVKPDLVDIEG